MILKLKRFVTPILINVQSRSKMTTNILVNTVEGTVRGKELYATSFSKKKYYAFQGIPYAEAPVGDLRFKDPQPLSSWEGVQDAVSEAPSCPQKHVLLKEAVGDEDNCLALNVYTPQEPGTNPSSPRPVMVWIHGGGFTFGSGNTDLHDPDYWMERGVIVVTCNYRVGALGFLSLGTSEVPGNAGLKDQVFVLRWVRRNISRFGGDPCNVTLFGESAGAASVHYHMLSPMSRGLFHRAILMSGCCLNNWAFSATAVARSFLLGQRLGRATDDSKQLVAFLRSLPAFDLVKNQNKVITNQDKQDSRVFPFVPCIEPLNGEGERFLTEHPRSLLHKGLVAPVPVIIGVNDKEGMLIMNDVAHTDDYFKVLDNNFSRIVPNDLGLPANSADTIRQFFFGNMPIGWKTVNEYFDYYGDVFFYIGVDEAIRLHLTCNVAPVFCYRLRYDGQLGFLSWFLRQLYPQCHMRGVCHADDLGYIFKYNIPGPPQLQQGTKEEAVVDLITRMWAEFAARGNPNCPDLKECWKSAAKDGALWRGFIDIDRRASFNDSRIEEERMKFWDSLVIPKTKL